MASLFDLDSLDDSDDTASDVTDFLEEVAEKPFDPTKEILLRYGTETARVDITTVNTAGKTLLHLVRSKVEELGISRNPSDLNYKFAGDYISGSVVPRSAGGEYVISASRDGKG
jgi:hypothetical protein